MISLSAVAGLALEIPKTHEPWGDPKELNNAKTIEVAKTQARRSRYLGWMMMVKRGKDRAWAGAAFVDPWTGVRFVQKAPLDAVRERKRNAKRR